MIRRYETFGCGSGAVTAVVLLLLGWHAAAGVPPAADAQLKVRPAAVAGIFYPSDPRQLEKKVDGFLADAKQPPVENLRALICPHAGYPYSGPVAGVGFEQLAGRDLRTIVLLGPSHYAAFKGAFVPQVDAYQTPLGNVMFAPLAKELLKEKPFTASPQCQVERPDWWRQSPREIPAFGQDGPDTWEHSVEVEIPFLQRVLPKAQIVPVTCGDVNPQDLAAALVKHLDDKTFVVVSSDLSHYTPYETAKHLDGQCIAAVLALDVEAMSAQQACGKTPIMALMQVAKEKGWRAKLLDYRNSGDTAGEKSAVVGYAAIAFYQPAAAPTTAPATAPAAAQPYTAQERKFLLDLARKTIDSEVTTGTAPNIDLSAVPPRLVEYKGCFVTLTKKGQLRGCIGYLTPIKPLFQAAMENAVAAAYYDSRFPPVKKDELGKIQIEISVLSIPRPLAFNSPEELLAQLRPGVDGVILRVGDQQATYLPQVWQQIPKKEDFLSQLAEKAGLPADSWRQKEATVQTYQDQVLKESEP